MGLQLTIAAGSAIPRRTLFLGLTLALATTVCPAGAESPADDDAVSPFGLRIVKAGGPGHRPEVRRHLEFCAGLGFNAVWVRSSDAGVWDRKRAPDGPTLHPGFAEFARWAIDRGLRPVVEIRPFEDGAGDLSFPAPPDLKRIRRFIRMLRRRAHVRDFVISFEGAPLAITEIRDVLRYGPVAAAAHVDLAARLQRAVPRRDRVWFSAALFSDSHLEDPELGYGPQLLEELRRLPSRVGMLWSGPEPVSPSIDAEDLETVRRRLGGRPLLLHDRYPGNWSRGGLVLGLVIGPLRNRDPAVAASVEGYVASPMDELGASRLPLLTIADFLRDPEGYEPDASWRSAMERLCGSDAAALEALRTQAMEWGGWVGERNYRASIEAFPSVAAARLRDPAYVASWIWTVRRYPDRMRAMRGIDDPVFRTALLDVMDRRLAVARAVPLAVELGARRAADEQRVRASIAELRRQREALVSRPTALEAFDRFTAAAGLQPLLGGPSE